MMCGNDRARNQYNIRIGVDSANHYTTALHKYIHSHTYMDTNTITCQTLSQLEAITFHKRNNKTSNELICGHGQRQSFSAGGDGGGKGPGMRADIRQTTRALKFMGS